MPKPKWLVDAEKKKQQVHREPNHCLDCQHIGEVVKFTKYRNKERTEVYECAIHPGCFNTKYSICCDDFAKRT